jgi:hypothetical protein
MNQDFRAAQRPQLHDDRCLATTVTSKFSSGEKLAASGRSSVTPACPWAHRPMDSSPTQHQQVNPPHSTAHQPPGMVTYFLTVTFTNPALS